jgi:serine/threonine-protein kinase
MLITILFFSGSIFIKFYFNEFFFVTPDLKNFTISQAEDLVSEGSFRIIETGEDFSQYEKDKIYSQEPKPGKIVKKGRVINVWISRGQDKITVPSFKGMDLSEAKVAAEKLGLIVKNIAYTEKNIAYNQVISCDPGEGSTIYRNKEISFLVNTKSVGEEVRMPDIIGLDLSRSEKILKFKKLILGNIDYIQNNELESGIIVDSSIQPGIMTLEGTVVDVIINR